MISNDYYFINFENVKPDFCYVFLRESNKVETKNSFLQWAMS